MTRSSRDHFSRVKGVAAGGFFLRLRSSDCICRPHERGAGKAPAATPLNPGNDPRLDRVIAITGIGIQTMRC